MPKKIGEESTRVQVTIDETTERVLNELALLGILGRSKAEIIGSILREWLWKNQADLRSNGITFSLSDPGNKR